MDLGIQGSRAPSARDRQRSNVNPITVSVCTTNVSDIYNSHTVS